MRPAAGAGGYWCWTLSQAKVATESICAQAGNKPAWCRTTRCFQTGGSATPRLCGNVSIIRPDNGNEYWTAVSEARVPQDHEPESVHSHLSGFPTDHRLLAGDAPMITGQCTTLAERAMAGHHERDWIFSDGGSDRP